jgi:FAD:protein FMN transferase
MQLLEFRAMGCHMLAALDSDSQPAASLLRVPDWFEKWEQQLSRFRETSELNHLNRNAGRWVRVGSVMWEVMQVALQAAEWSEGLVAPTLLNAVEAAGYDRTFEAIDSSAESARAITPVFDGQWPSIDRNPGNRSIRLPNGVRVDFGGVAKGWAADRAARRLGRHGPALIDAGGDIAMSGPLIDGQPWPIGIADPANPNRQIGLLHVRKGGIATSGRDYRRWQRNGVWQHHIIDPRIGLPAQTDVLSATVIGPTTLEAEVAAKAALILGSEAGLKWLEARPQFAGLLVLESGQVLHSSRMKNYLES